MNSSLKDHMIEAMNENVRYDNRKLDQYREIVVEYGVSKNAEGSARVKIGNTEVFAGVKFELGSPFPDKPDQGSIIVNTELLPLSNPEFESGPPGIDSIELARVVDRGIRESKALDFKTLCITPGEKVWLVLIDVITINDEGNLFDAAALAANAALLDTHFPKIENDKINYKESSGKRLEITSIPTAVTVHKLGNHLFIDPTIEEGEASDARLTVVSLENGKICAMQKGGESELFADEIMKMIDLAMLKSHELRQLLKHRKAK